MSEDPQVLPLSRATRDRVRGPEDSTSCPRRLMLGPLREVRRGQPAVPCDLGPRPRARNVNQLFWENRSCAGGPVVSSSSPGRLVLFAEAPWGRPPSPGDSGPGPRARSVDQHSRTTPALFQGPRIQ